MRVVNTLGRWLTYVLNVPTAVIVMVFILLFIVRWHGGFLSYEPRLYMAHYTSDRPVRVKILDCNVTDNGAYQAREISYAFDWLDYNFCRLCARWGFPHYLSLTSYLGLACLCLLLAGAFRNLLGLSRPMTNAVLLLFLTHPNALLLGPVFRSSKIGAAVCLIALCCVIAKCRGSREERKFSKPAWPQMLGIFLLSFTAAWFDRQGFFLVACGAFLVALYSGTDRNLKFIAAAILGGVIISRPYGVLTLPTFAYSLGFFAMLAGLVFLLFYSLADRNAKWIAGTMCAALAAHQAYNWWLMPALMDRVVGYRPSFDYQAMDPNFVIGRMWTFFGWGAGVISDNLRWLLGSLPLPLCAVICLAALWITARDCGISPTPASVLKDGRILVALTGLALLMLMFAMMFAGKAASSLRSRESRTTRCRRWHCSPSGWPGCSPQCGSGGWSASALASSRWWCSSHSTSRHGRLT